MFNPISHSRLGEVKNKQDTPAGEFVTSNQKEILGFDLFYLLVVGGSAEYTHDCASLTQLSQTLHDNQMIFLERHHSNVWKSHLVCFGNADVLCISRWSWTTLWDSDVINLLKHFLIYLRSKVYSRRLLPAIYESKKILLQTKPSLCDRCWRCNFFGWRLHKVTCNTSRLAWRLSLSSVSPPCYKADTSTAQLSSLFPSSSNMDVWPLRRHCRPYGEFAELTGYFYSAQMDSIESLFATIGEADLWGKVINARESVGGGVEYRGARSLSSLNFTPLNKPGEAFPQSILRLRSRVPSLRLLENRGADQYSESFSVHRIPKKGEILGFAQFPLVGAGGSAEYTHNSAPAATLTQLSNTVHSTK